MRNLKPASLKTFKSGSLQSFAVPSTKYPPQKPVPPKPAMPKPMLPVQDFTSNTRPVQQNIKIGIIPMLPNVNL
jgi:hypothetical protein